MIPKGKDVSDETFEKNFRPLLKEFEAIEPKTSKSKDKLLALSDKARNTPLTYRQMDAITGRCANAINDDFYPRSKEK